jgi:TRAP-type C4-dicarboxylate transport system substrate-binding protein
LSKELKDAVTKAGRDTIAFADEAYTKSQNESLEGLKKAATVTTMPPAELAKMKELAMKGVWEQMKNDPARGPVVKLLAEDVARFTKK